MKKILGILIFLSSFNSLAQNTIRVAIIDTGLKQEYAKNVPMCPDGHRDFTKEGFNDTHGHGTNVTGLITSNIKTLKYCVILIKAYKFNPEPKVYLTEALEHTSKVNAQIVNISSGGLGEIAREKTAILKLLNKGVTIVAAAGNNSLDLDKDCNYYPACYDKRIYVIGNKSKTSNHGKIVDDILNGNNQTGFGITLTGTSQSTAVFTNQLLKTIEGMLK